MKNCLVVNLFGAPGSGKSTGAAYIFSKLKLLGVNCELVTEFAKAVTWENSKEVLDDQIYVFAKQEHSLFRLRDKVDVIITDSPLLLSLVYGAPHYPYFDDLVLSVFRTYNNLNFYLIRDKDYTPVGRNQSETESEQIGEDILNILQATETHCFLRHGNESGYKKIVGDICEVLGISHRVKQNAQLEGQLEMGKDLGIEL